MDLYKRAARLGFLRLEIGQFLAVAYHDGGRVEPAAAPSRNANEAKKAALALCQSLGPYWEGFVVERRAEQEPDEFNTYYPLWVFEAVEWRGRQRDYAVLTGRFVVGYPYQVDELFRTKLERRPRRRLSELAG
jgi:hypothetical protein